MRSLPPPATRSAAQRIAESEVRTLRIDRDRFEFLVRSLGSYRGGGTEKQLAVDWGKPDADGIYDPRITVVYLEGL